ncbi:putative ATP-grasp target RiPP [Streptosporangium sp. CA-135522]|uniref:putative ATP-grasp target RiPP n=1 Tax=Streptosporangium sp. CA-135522 TaxID=3240072 RepID=UPI003D914467
MSEIKIDDIAPLGAELNENDLRLVSGGRMPDKSKSSLVIDGVDASGDGTTGTDADF